MNFLWHLFDSFVPNEKNGYKPHFFRVRTVLVVGVAIFALGLGSLFIQKTLVEGNEYLAAVISSAIIDLTNADREAENLGQLSLNPLLERAAQRKAADMAAKNYFAHTAPDGTTPWYWFEAAGYDFTYAGENLAVRFYDSIEVVRAWMDSPGHRANILNQHFTEIGIGIAEGTFEGKPTVFVVQMFGAPAPTSLKTVSQDVPLAASEIVIATSTEEVLVAGAESHMETVDDKAGNTNIASSVPKVILEDETFIAVKNEATTSAPAVAAGASPDASVSLIHQLITSPQSTIQMVYVLLSIIVGIALLIMVVVEVGHQHLGNAALGVFLLFLMAGFLYVGQASVEPLIIL